MILPASQAALWGDAASALNAVIPNLGCQGVLGLQLPEILASTARGEGFWVFESRNAWAPKVYKPLHS